MRMKYPISVDLYPRIVMQVSSLTCMKIATCTICFSFVLIAVFRVLNDIHEIGDYEEVESTTLYHQLYNFAQDDEMIIGRLKLDLVHPTNEPYSLNNPLPVEHVLAREVRQINLLKVLSQKSPVHRQSNCFQRGFFIEIGAGDGEYRSPTLCLEAEDGWSGMLIEVDPVLGSHLKNKKRKAIIAIACVGSSNFSYIGFLWESRVMPPDWDGPENYTEEDMMMLETSCYPIYSFLEAADVRAVDFLTVNINGEELGVLKTFPWGKVRVKIVAVKVQDPKKEDSISAYMSSIGYSYRNLFVDTEESFLMFVANNILKSNF